MQGTNAKLAIANWKSHKTLEEAEHWVESVGKNLRAKNVHVVITPPFPFVYPLRERIKKKNYDLALGVQDLSQYPAGAYTGAVCARNLEGLGVKYAILGHSERRRYFHDSHQTVANKAALAIEVNIIPVVCVDRGDILAQSNAIEPDLRNKCIVAFEPIEHIGTGESDTVEDVLNIAEEIRSAFGEVRVLYGGSVNSGSAAAFLNADELDGILVGSASLDPEHFVQMLSL